MTIPQTDLRALRRAPRTTDQLSSSSPVVPGVGTVVPHPKARWATRLFIPAAVLLATGGLLAYAARDAFQNKLEVYVAAVIPKDIVSGESHAESDSPKPIPTDGPAETPLGPVAVQAPGWIEPAPYTTNVPALAEGVVKEVLVLEGEHIEAGQVIARLIDEDARLALRAAEAVVTERDADVARARAAMETAESQVDVERTAAAELRDEVTQKRDLVAAGGISAGAFRRMEIRLSGLEAKIVTASKMVNEARAALGQAISAHAAAHVLRDEVALRLERMDVRSPVAGIVLARLVEPGSRISMSGKGGDSGPSGGMTGAVLRVYDPAKLQVRVDVPLADAAKINIGTRAIVSTEAMADQTFSGVVTRVVHEANIQRNTVQFKVALDVPSPVLKPEMLTRVKLHSPASASQRGRISGSEGSVFGDAESGEMTLVVPTAAVTSIGEGKGQVWIVDTTSGRPVARLREITILLSADAGFVAVTSGLRLTDRVILDPPKPPAISDGTLLKLLGERTSTAVDPVTTNP